MILSSSHMRSGLPGLDRALKGFRPGDNVVFQVDSIEDYDFFVQRFAKSALESKRHLIYFRFAKHPPLLTADMGVEVHEIHPEAGFETLITELHQVIEKAGRGAYYVFDCLSDLAVDWYSDEMLGNFFMLTCPYLYDLETLAFFAILRTAHSVRATGPIIETTQIFMDVFRHQEKVYVHPIKVQQRFSPTMHMLHVVQDDEMLPVMDSVTIARVLTSVPRLGISTPTQRMDVWHRAFLQAEEVLSAIGQCQCSEEKAKAYLNRLLRMVVTRDDYIIKLVEQRLGMRDVLDIGKRMIGTGLIGGKSVGMLLARAILKQTDPKWIDRLEVHDSFFIGSDVFYTFLVRNGCWWFRQKQRNPDTFMDDAEKARQRILTGKFPDYIVRQFSEMLDYYGQSPIIVRSSSLLEDNFGNSFVGKYESVFCPNQGHRTQRLEDFMSAIKTIYASTMSEKALRYRAQRGLLEHDEQMALLVQRVSGRHYGDLYYPQIAGVGFSFNPYVWSEDIDPNAGVLRIVYGLGTRAVDRSDNDYTRVVALNNPEKRPEISFDEMRASSQRRVDVLDLEANQIDSGDFSEIARRSPDMPLELFADRDYRIERLAKEMGIKDNTPWVLTFHSLFRDTTFIQEMREMLRTLQEAYQYPVDIEFTANFNSPEDFKINLVQCRPLQVKEGGSIPETPENLREEDLVLKSHGAVVGQSRLVPVNRIIYVVPFAYFQLSGSERCSVARLIGQLTHLNVGDESQTLMLMGPGRWGTTMPSLGVPVTFAEINTVSILCEIVEVREDLTPEVSLGTHFFSELVEMDILYFAAFPLRKDTYLNRSFLENSPNKLTQVLPGAEKWESVVKVIDPDEIGHGKRMKICANSLKQNIVCYFEQNGLVT